MAKSPMDTILDRINELEKNVLKEQEKQTTCVGDACKVLEDKMAKKIAELDALKSELDKKVDTCVGKHCEILRKDIAAVRLQQTQQQKIEQPAEEEADPNKSQCPTCGYEMETGRVGTKTECPQCKDVFEWKEQ